MLTATIVILLQNTYKVLSDLPTKLMEAQTPHPNATFTQILPVIDGMNNADLGQPDQRNKRCCDCNCDCGQTLVNTFADIVGDKLHHIYEHFNLQQKQLDRIEGLLNSVVSIRYPELKRKVGAGMELTTNDLDDDDQNDTPKKRRRIYSHDISVHYLLLSMLSNQKRRIR